MPEHGVVHPVTAALPESACQLGNVDGDESVSGFTVISARDLDHASELAQGCPALEHGQGIEVGELLEL